MNKLYICSVDSAPKKYEISQQNYVLNISNSYRRKPQHTNITNIDKVCHNNMNPRKLLNLAKKTTKSSKEKY